MSEPVRRRHLSDITSGRPEGDERAEAGEPVRIVLSYRREDAAGHAGHLYADLAEHFSDVFMDIDAIEPGADFTEVITEAIANCDVLIAMIGRGWLNATDPKGLRRIDKEDDFVRLELEAALERKVRVVPVLVQEADMPGFEDLPSSIAPFARRQALEISDRRWHADVGVVIKALEVIARDKVDREAQRTAGRDRTDSDARQEEARQEEARQEVARQEVARLEVAREDARRQQVLGDQQRERARVEALRDHVRVQKASREVDQGMRRAVSPAPPRQSRGKVRENAWLVAAGTAVAVLVLGLVVAISLTTGSNGGGTVQKTIEVLATVPWSDTGIDLERGQRVEINASGTIATNKYDPARDSVPDGKAGEEFGDNIVMGVGHGALIRKIGTGEPAAVGSHLEFTAESDGPLYLGVNDPDLSTNNGWYTATITVS